ncbi:hypothetical protein Cgig2_027955 [Carnegiea gigantea]|uniref:RING-type E3 ubiquitin transferase n=1 Tax=Carnegiea gigantea TaxID=171969 RepID=A0A9Q1GL99_9CARY|nr:hypothetical protein Cgig2_027955 [Carnegiea gigantea]
MATHLTKFPSDHDPSLATTSSSSSSSSPPPAKIEERENPTTSSAAYTGTCCYNSLKLSPPFDSAMALTVLVLLIALFFMGFFSIYIRRFADESSVDPTRRRRRRGSELSSTASYLARSKNKGVDPTKVESLPVHAYEGGGAKHGIDCAICLAEFQERERVKEIPYCRHVFHSDCIDKWLSSHVTCPLCRTAKLFAGEEEEETEKEEEEGGLSVGEAQGSDGGGEVRIVVEPETDTWNENNGETDAGPMGGSRSTSTSTCSRRGLGVANFGVATEREGNRRGSRGSGKSGQRKKGADFNGGKVSEMVLRSGRKHVHSAGSPEMSGRTGKESDLGYCSGDEGGSQHNGSESYASEEVSSSCSDHMKGELRSKKRHDVRREGQREVGHRKGYGVKGKGKAGEVKRRSTSDERKDDGIEQAVDVDIRHRCALDAICALNDQLSDIQKEAVRGMVWMGSVAFERSDGGSEVEQVLKGAMEERVCRERQRRRTAQKDVRIYRNYVSVLLELCRVNNTVERVAMFKKLYTFLVLSGLLFPRGAGGAAWDLVHVVEDVDGVGEYNWAEAVWEFLVHAMEESREKMGSTKNLQTNGFAMIRQVWFCEHSIIYAFADERKVPRPSSWVNLYKSKKYVAGVVVRKLKDSEVGLMTCMQERDAPCLCVESVDDEWCYKCGGMTAEGERCTEEGKRSTCKGEGTACCDEEGTGRVEGSSCDENLS